MAVGPLAGIAFFAPWMDGPGPLAGIRFSGFALVAFTGRLTALDLSAAEWSGLMVVRALVLGVAVAAAWQGVTALRFHWHAAYALSGWYIVAAGLILGVSHLAADGLATPPAGTGLLVAAGLMFIAGRPGRRELQPLQLVERDVRGRN